jgi:hypothetical protein
MPNTMPIDGAPDQRWTFHRSMKAGCAAENRRPHEEEDAEVDEQHAADHLLGLCSSFAEAEMVEGDGQRPELS